MSLNAIFSDLSSPVVPTSAPPTSAPEIGRLYRGPDYELAYSWNTEKLIGITVLTGTCLVGQVPVGYHLQVEGHLYGVDLLSLRFTLQGLLKQAWIETPWNKESTAALKQAYEQVCAKNSLTKFEKTHKTIRSDHPPHQLHVDFCDFSLAFTQPMRPREGWWGLFDA